MSIENPYMYPHESYDPAADMDTIKPGITLRDWFAGQALVGILATGARPDFGDALRRIIADDAFGYADAMLAQRSAG